MFCWRYFSRTFSWTFYCPDYHLNVIYADSFTGWILLSSDVWVTCFWSLLEATFFCLGVKSSKGFRLGPGLGNFAWTTAGSRLSSLLLRAAFSLWRFSILVWASSLSLVRLSISLTCWTHSVLAWSTWEVASCKRACRIAMSSRTEDSHLSVIPLASSWLSSAMAGNGNSASLMEETPSS